jgi:hypothetical protein
VSKLPSAYVLSKFLVHSYEPLIRKHDGIYNAGCPVCKEGKSLGKKKRLFYYPQSNSFYCWNCNKSWNAYEWITNVTGSSKEDIEIEARSREYSTDLSERIFNGPKTTKKILPSLPHDCINLSDHQQQKFWKNNGSYNRAMDYIKSRRLDTAVNRPLNYYLSLTDYFHKDRLIIPYLDINKQIIFYQSRALDGTEPRYLNKVGYDKSLFGIERIDPTIDYIFQTEGPTDCMFLKNGVCLAGLVLTKTQKKQLVNFPFHQKIWILDNPKFDSEDKVVQRKIVELLENGQRVFKWPDLPYKDLNELAVKKGIDEIPISFILQNLY